MTQYKPYAEYKESGVEWMPSIPSHWSTSSIGHQVTFNPRPTLEEKRANPRVTFLPMSAVGTDGSLELTDTRQFSDLDGSYTFFREGDLCFAKVTPCFENGKGAVLTGLSAGMGFGSSELTVVTPKKPEQVNILKYYLVLQPFRQLGTSWMSGTAGLQRVPDLFAKSFPFFAAPLPEQQAIATFLDRETAKIDALIEKKSKFIELLEEKRQALISHAVTKGLTPDAPMKDSGVPWLGEVPAHWEIRRLRHLLSETIRYGANATSESDQETWPRFIRITDIDRHGKLKQDPKVYLSPQIAADFLLRDDDILLARSGATVGKSFHYRDEGHPCAFAGYLLLVRCNPSALLSSFFIEFTQSTMYWEYLASNTIQATIQNVNAERYGELSLALPPVQEQQSIVNRLMSFRREHDALITTTERSITLLREKRSALITAAVTGQIDVRDEVAV